ncbi:hypothetical protein BH18ACT13_BH18ACT13_05490 [soil metagenome]
MHAAITCRKVERWEQTTPLGSPVVPHVYHMAAAERSSTSGHVKPGSSAATSSS